MQPHLELKVVLARFPLLGDPVVQLLGISKEPLQPFRRLELGLDAGRRAQP